MKKEDGNSLKTFRLPSSFIERDRSDSVTVLFERLFEPQPLQHSLTLMNGSADLRHCSAGLGGVIVPGRVCALPSE
jgi:hypothetical protein